MRQWLRRVLFSLENRDFALAIRNGLIMIIPVLMVGSISLILQHLPIPAYQAFLALPMAAVYVDIINFMYNATFGMLSVYLALAIGIYYGRKQDEAHPYGPPITALICFFILTGVLSGDPAWGALGVKGMFTAIVSATFGSCLYGKLAPSFGQKLKAYSDGADAGFNHAVAMIFPALMVAAIFAAVNALIGYWLGITGFQELFVKATNALFAPLGRSLFSGLLFVLLSSLLWFFGIHGSNVLEAVTENLFTPATEMNMAAVVAGQAPTEILTKTFFDVFVLIGGCGSALCLLLAIVLFSRRLSDRRLSKLAAAPMLFNINEIMIFGLPVIYNPFLLAPFLLTPLVSFLVSYLAMYWGLVPLVTASVDWTTPVLVGGYLACGSWRGVLLQLVNVTLGILLYRPFVLAYDRRREENARLYLAALVARYQESEQKLTPVVLTELTDECGDVARTLAADLQFALENGKLCLHFQPQYGSDLRCLGAEALLRWSHPRFGLLYPPLVIQLAREGGILVRLEQWILAEAVAQADLLRQQTGLSLEIGVNVSAATIQDRAYTEYALTLAREKALVPGSICLEITEQTALQTGVAAGDLFDKLHQTGYKLAIDDFSMGHTSLAYLRDNRFDLVKLDGSLVKGLTENPRCRDIIESIVHLSQSLGFAVLAEYVETEWQRQALAGIGCQQYQGYLFSPAVPVTELIVRLNREEKNPQN